MQLKTYQQKIVKNYLPIEEFFTKEYPAMKKEEIYEILKQNKNFIYTDFCKRIKQKIKNTKLNIVSLVSGWWTTMDNLAEKLNSWELWLIELVWVIASKSWIWAIDKSIKHKIHTVILNKFHSKDPYTLNALAELFKADIIIWNWWLPLIPAEVIENFTQKGWIILNQHPGPLRANHLDFGGKWMVWWLIPTAARILYLLETNATWKELFTESTVHIMTEKFDEWYSVWVKKLYFEKEIEEYRKKIENLEKSTKWDLKEKKRYKKALLRTLISDIQQKLLKLEHENVAETIKNIWETKKAEKYPSYDEILVPEENRKILEKAKQKAIEMYPNG